MELLPVLVKHMFAWNKKMIHTTVWNLAGFSKAKNGNPSNQKDKKVDFAELHIVYSSCERLIIAQNF